MHMKHHLLAALTAEFDQWERLLTTLTDDQLTAPHPPDGWSIKDEIAHLHAWQQRSIARLEAAHDKRPPLFPQWGPDLDPEADADTDPVNAWIYDQYRDWPWADVYAEWRAGYQRLLALTDALAERDLLNGDGFAWLAPYSPADVVIGSYDHHQEHWEALIARLQNGGM